MRGTRAFLVFVALATVAAGLVVRWSCAGDRVRVATFNIENYPKSRTQVEGAFALLDELDVGAVAVQEIKDPKHFAAQARARLGDGWRFEHSGAAPLQRVGVLYDGQLYELLESIVHSETVIYAGGKPVVEARLRARGDGETVRFFALHLKAGGDHAHTRSRQLDALTPVLARAARSGERVIVAGDFNATGDADRRRLARLAEATELRWVTEDLACTAYWNRSDGCRGSALDHVLMSWTPGDVTARGPCETEGCDPAERCPTFHAEVSDHCPVTLDL